MKRSASAHAGADFGANVRDERIFTGKASGDALRLTFLCYNKLLKRTSDFQEEPGFAALHRR